MTATKMKKGRKARHFSIHGDGRQDAEECDDNEWADHHAAGFSGRTTWFFWCFLCLCLVEFVCVCFFSVFFVFVPSHYWWQRLSWSSCCCWCSGRTTRGGPGATPLGGATPAVEICKPRNGFLATRGRIGPVGIMDKINLLLCVDKINKVKDEQDAG